MFPLLSLIFGSWRTFLISSFITSIIAFFFTNLVDFLRALMLRAIYLVGSVAGNGPDSVSLTYEGLAAYFSYHFKFSECLAVILSCVLLRWLLVKIPFIKW